VPSQRTATIVAALPSLPAPTAVHAAAAEQETAVSTFVAPPAGAGIASSDQPVPSHCSANAVSLPPLWAYRPTAEHATLGLVLHETASRLTVCARGGSEIAWNVQLVPSQLSASVCCVPLASV
jgi:hypothetical protein